MKLMQMKRLKEFNDHIEKKKRNELTIMESIKNKQKEMQETQKRAMDDLEHKLEKHQQSATEKQQQIFKEKEWKNKLKAMRFMDMEENKRHLQRVTAIKVGNILEKHKTAMEKLREKSTKLDGFLKENM